MFNFALIHWADEGAVLPIRAEAAPGHSRNVSVGQQQVCQAQVHIETSF
jgi:hypothetical protein